MDAQRDGAARGRGRNARGGRGGRGGRGRPPRRNGSPVIESPHLIDPLNDSGEEDSEDEEALVQQEQLLVQQQDLTKPFPQYDLLDGGSSDEEENEEAGDEMGEDDIPVYTQLLHPKGIDNLGEDHQMHYAFEFGRPAGYNPYQKYASMSPFDIVLFFASAFFAALLSCTNAVLNPAQQISMRDLYLYHAFLLFRCMVPLSTNESYWCPQTVFIEWKDEAKILFTLFSLRKFYEIRRKLKGYMPYDDVPEKTRDWKVKRVVDAVVNAFRATVDAASQFLTIDEAMARGSATRNPIYVTLGKAKPLEGFRFILLVEYQTKAIINMWLDNKEITAENSAGFAGGYCGRIMRHLIETCTCLPGRWYKIMADNYYNTVAFTAWLRNTLSILIGGTMQKKYVPAEVQIGSAKKPKPTRANPKGTLRIAQNHEDHVYIYSWMDSALVYFIDPMYGPGKTSFISRTLKKVVTDFLVPQFIHFYNKYMHAVDVVDQQRKLFGVDLLNATRKFTVRIFEIMWSFILVQAYNVYRNVHLNTARSLTHTEFKVAIFKAILKSHVVSRIPIADDEVFATWKTHKLYLYPAGTRKDGTNRRQHRSCVFCPNHNPDGTRNYKRSSVYYCKSCDKCLHVLCHGPYHDEKFAQLVSPPAKKRK